MTTAPTPNPAGLVKIIGPYPPPSGGVLGPGARRTNSHIFQVFDSLGRKMVGGSFGPDPVAALTYAKKVAAEKGYPDPVVEHLPPDPRWMS